MDAALHIGEPWMWAAFVGFVLVMLAVDLFLVGGNKAHKVSFKEAATWSFVWFGLAMLFNLALWWHLKGAYGAEVADVKAMEFLTGYLIEKSLAVDNIFVFLMIFSFFAVPAEYQRRVLIYGVIGAILMRAVVIAAGAWLVQEFHWILYLFGAFLVITGIKMLMAAEAEPDMRQNPLLNWFKRHLPLTPDYRGEKFWVMENGVRVFTPLFLVLIMIELSDLILRLIRFRRFSPSPPIPSSCHFEHLCHSRIACDVLHARRHGRTLPFAEVWPGAGAGVRRHQDADRRFLQNPDRVVARHCRPHHCDFHVRQPVGHAQTVRAALMRGARWLA